MFFGGQDSFCFVFNFHTKQYGLMANSLTRKSKQKRRLSTQMYVICLNFNYTICSWHLECVSARVDQILACAPLVFEVHGSLLLIPSLCRVWRRSHHIQLQFLQQCKDPAERCLYKLTVLHFYSSSNSLPQNPYLEVFIWSLECLLLYFTSFGQLRSKPFELR